MRTQKLKKEYIHIRIDKELKDKYLEYCEKNGYSLSKLIRNFIKNEIDEKNKKLD